METINQTQEYQIDEATVMSLHDSNKNLSDLNLVLLQKIDHDLKEICLEFDPYTQENLKIYKAMIATYQLNQWLDNPFLFTNKMLQLLDKVEQAIKVKAKRNIQ